MPTYCGLAPALSPRWALSSPVQPAQRTLLGNPDDLFKTARLARNTCNISAILLGEGWRKAVVNSRSLSQLIYSGLTPSTPLGWLGSAPYQTDYSSIGTATLACSFEQIVRHPLIGWDFHGQPRLACFFVLQQTKEHVRAWCYPHVHETALPLLIAARIKAGMKPIAVSGHGHGEAVALGPVAGSTPLWSDRR